MKSFTFTIKGHAVALTIDELNDLLRAMEYSLRDGGKEKPVRTFGCVSAHGLAQKGPNGVVTFADGTAARTPDGKPYELASF